MNSKYTEKDLIPIELRCDDYVRLVWERSLYVSAYIKAMLDHLEPYLKVLQPGVDFKLTMDDLLIQKYKQQYSNVPENIFEQILASASRSIHVISTMNLPEDVRLSMISTLNLLSMPDEITPETAAETISAIELSFARAELFTLELTNMSCKYMYSKMMERLKTHTELLDSTIATVYHSIKADLEYLDMYIVFLEHVLLSFGLTDDMNYVPTMESLRTISYELSSMIDVIEPKPVPRDITVKNILIPDNPYLARRTQDFATMYQDGSIQVPPVEPINVTKAMNNLLHSNDKVVMYMYKPVYISATSIYEVINSHKWKDMELLSERVWQSMFIEIIDM